MIEEWLECSGEVELARMNGQPIVALESTVIAHGLPYPENRAVAEALQGIIRDHGAVPATIALAGGKIHVGCGPELLDRLAKGEEVTKVSSRDIPVVLAEGGLGATTVAATMLCASKAGIKLFATGGIGGVHLGGADSMDISADLSELARTDVAVVCAGAKSILDIGRTLEVLETMGVPVVGYRTKAFPAFYVADSGFPTPARIDEVDGIARMLAAKWALGLEGGAVIANPVPAQEALEAGEMEQAVHAALREAGAQGVRGKDLTPFLLERIRAETEGRSLSANIALLEANASLAAEIAVALPREEITEL